MKSKSMETKRWWDFYLIRYLIGTIIGTVVFFFVLKSFIENGIIDENLVKFLLTSEGDLNLLALFMGGFAFSYLASSPILIAHAIRLNVKQVFSKSTKTEMSLSAILIVIITAVALGFLIKAFFDIHFIVMIISCLVLIPFVLLVFLWATDKGRHGDKRMRNVYFKMVESRKGNEDFAQSYRHLREHGNAFFIVVTEILLGISLSFASSHWDVLLIISVWVIPPSMIWFFANYLERKLLYDKGPNSVNAREIDKGTALDEIIAEAGLGDINSENEAGEESSTDVKEGAEGEQEDSDPEVPKSDESE